MGSIVNDTPKRRITLGNVSYDIMIVKIGSRVCAQLILLHVPQNPMFCNALQWARVPDIPKLPLAVTDGRTDTVP